MNESHRIAVLRQLVGDQLTGAATQVEIAVLSSSIADDVALDRAIGEAKKRLDAAEFIFRKMPQAKAEADIDAAAAAEWHPARKNAPRTAGREHDGAATLGHHGRPYRSASPSPSGAPA